MKVSKHSSGAGITVQGSAATGETHLPYQRANSAMPFPLQIQLPADVPGQTAVLAQLSATPLEDRRVLHGAWPSQLLRAFGRGSQQWGHLSLHLSVK